MMTSHRYRLATVLFLTALFVTPVLSIAEDSLMDTTKHPVSVTMAMQADSFFGFNPGAAQDYYRWIGPYAEMKLAGGMGLRFTVSRDLTDNQDFYKIKFIKTF